MALTMVCSFAGGRGRPSVIGRVGPWIARQYQMARLLKTLRSKLYQVELAKREEELSKFYGDRGSISWGNQIRSYVLHPYQLVKDLRTGIETGNVAAILDGDLDHLINEYLKRRKAKSG